MLFDLVYPPTPAPLYPLPTASHPGRPEKITGERLPLVEPSGLVYGQASRRWCHSGAKALHPVVHLHIIDREGRLYLQKRSMTKDLLPGYWDTAVGGHVSYGELAMEALYRDRDNFTEIYNRVAFRNLPPDILEYMNTLWENVKIS